MFEVKDTKERIDDYIAKIQRNAVEMRSMSVVFFDVPWMDEVIEQVCLRLGNRIYRKGDDVPYSKKLLKDAISAHSERVHYIEWGDDKIPDKHRIMRLYESLHAAATALVPFVFEANDDSWNICDGTGFDEILGGVPAAKIRVRLDAGRLNMVSRLDFRTHRIPLVDRYEKWYEMIRHA